MFPNYHLPFTCLPQTSHSIIIMMIDGGGGGMMDDDVDLCRTLPHYQRALQK